MLNNEAMQSAAATLQTVLAYAQLHEDPAGENGTDNVVADGRQAISWTTPAGYGDFGLHARHPPG